MIYLAKNSGFCSGVENAVDTAKKNAGKNTYVLGEIIHNKSVIKELEELGVKTINSLGGVKSGGAARLIIRSHGESEEVFLKLKEKGVEIIDATCVFVKKIHEIVKNYHGQGFQIIIIGEKNHPEVLGINGWCGKNALIIGGEEDIPPLEKYEKICVVAQTTCNKEAFDGIVKKILQKYNKKVEIFNTICYTTAIRQQEAEILARKCSVMVVLGGLTSSNTNKLYEICKSHCKNVVRSEDGKDLDYNSLRLYNNIGIVAGASTPRAQVTEVYFKMEENSEVKNIQGEKEEAFEQIKAADISEGTPIIKDLPAKQASGGPAEQISGAAATEQAPEKKEKVRVKAEKAPAQASEKKETALPPKSARGQSEMMEQALEQIPEKNENVRKGQLLTATISSAVDEGLLLYITNMKKEILLPKEEMSDEVYNKADYQNKVGEGIDVVVKDVKPNVLLSAKLAKRLKDEDALLDEIKSGKEFSVMCTGTNKGGLTSKFADYQVFVPSSYIKIGFVKELEKYVGKPLRLKMVSIEEGEKRKQIVASQRVIFEAERQQRDKERDDRENAFFDSIKENDIVNGKTVRFAAFGAFVEVDGFDCLAHVSDLAWQPVKQVSDVLELNKYYDFVILKIDRERKKVSLGYKQLQPKPWQKVAEKFAIGSIVKGKVVGIVSFGAFVEIDKGVDGLVHVSQISHEWLENPTSTLKVGNEVEVKILDIDVDREKITLSIKALLPESAESKKPFKKDEDGAEAVGGEGKEKPRFDKKGGRKPRGDEGGEREWNEDNVSGASIADLLNNKKD